jgi:hypothetical protein
VTNTPWGDQHCYVLGSGHPADDRDGDDEGSAHPSAPRVLRGEFAKALHVSPLMGMQHTYDWRLSVPAETLSVQIDSARDGERFFDATLALQRRECSARELRRALVRYPLLTLRLTTRIYAHALRLRMRGAAWHARPEASSA